jgi:hypothetical protein
MFINDYIALREDITLKDMTIYIKEAVHEQPIQTLETILVQMDGIERALVDTNDGEVKITYNEAQVNQDKIKRRILQHGLHIQND